MQGLWSNCVRETFPVCKRSATLTDHYVKCQLALKLWLWQLSSKATLLRWITALWSFIYPRMSGQQRQQAVILWATTAVPDLRWNETSNRKTPIRIKTPVTRADCGSKLILQPVTQMYNPSPFDWALCYSVQQWRKKKTSRGGGQVDY